MTHQSITRRPIHLLRYWWKQRYKFVLTILLHVCQQVWWLEAIPGETHPLVDTSSNESKKYSSSLSKHQLEYTHLFELSIYANFLWFWLKGINLWINLIFPFMSLTTILSYEWQIWKVMIWLDKDMQYLHILGNKIKLDNHHIIQS